MEIWLDRSPGEPLLAQLAAGQITLDHAALASSSRLRRCITSGKC